MGLERTSSARIISPPFCSRALSFVFVYNPEPFARYDSQFPSIRIFQTPIYHVFGQMLHCQSAAAKARALSRAFMFRAIKSSRQSRHVANSINLMYYTNFGHMSTYFSKNPHSCRISASPVNPGMRGKKKKVAFCHGKLLSSVPVMYH